MSFAALITADQHSLPVRHSLAVSPSKSRLPLPLPPSPPSDDGNYDTVHHEVHKRTNTLSGIPGGGRISSSLIRSPSPKTEKRGIIRKRSGSFDSHHTLSTKNH